MSNVTFYEESTQHTINHNIWFDFFHFYRNWIIFQLLIGVKRAVVVVVIVANEVVLVEVVAATVKVAAEVVSVVVSDVVD